MQIEITYEEALQLLDRAVEEVGAHYVLPKSAKFANFYDDGMPACIIGHVLVYKGHTASTLGATFQHSSIQAIATADADKEGTFPVRYSDPRVLWLLAYAQDEQDRGTPWGDAVRVAKESVARRLGS